MSEVILYAVVIVCVLHLVVVFFLLMFGDEISDAPKWLWWPLLFTLPMSITGGVYYIHAKEEPQYNHISHLEYEGIMQPKFVYEYNKFLFYDDKGDTIHIRELNGYETDSATVADGVMMYRKIYPRIWGIFIHHPETESKYIYTIKVTDAIRNATLAPVELNSEE